VFVLLFTIKLATMPLGEFDTMAKCMVAGRRLENAIHNNIRKSRPSIEFRCIEQKWKKKIDESK